MSAPLRVVFLDIRAEDVALLERELNRAGFDFLGHQARAGEGTLAALAVPIDLVFIDCALSNHQALEALGRLRGQGEDIPFIVVAGPSELNRVLEGVRWWADEYLFTDRPARVGLVVRNALELRACREFKRRAEEALRQADESLRASEERHRRQLEFASAINHSLGEGVYAVDRAGRLTFMNPAAERLLGWTEAELLGRNMHQAVHFQHADGTPFRSEDCPLLGVLYTGVPAQVGEDVFTRKDGRLITVAYSSAPIRGSGEVTGAVIAFQDISRQKRLEAQYLQAQKMEALGRLAGGVAHDFNNLLTIISGYGDLLRNHLPEEDPAHPLLSAITTAGDRAASLTRQLLAFSRPRAAAPQVVDLKVMIAETVRLLRRLIGEDVEVVTVSEPDLGGVRADPGQVVQVLMNLAVNARDAMPRGGKIIIETRNFSMDESYVHTRPGLAVGHYVLLAVTDTGAGMPPEVRAQVFEPFFSTKEPGKGTGLGLAVVHGVVKQAGGHVEVYSEPGMGTTFKLYFPRVTGVPDSGPAHAAPAPLPCGSETVLLAADDDGVRPLAAYVLGRCGYTVLEARDGAAAVRVAEEHGGRIDLLVTDAVMPHMGGRELAERLRLACPGMKVLFLSGYAEEGVVGQGAVEAGAAFLQKPYSPASLAAKVRQVLDES
jgi:PAS domain S-box-containing protein